MRKAWLSYFISAGNGPGGALWVYLAGRSPPVRRTCVKGCPVGIPCWTESMRPKDMQMQYEISMFISRAGCA